MHTSGRLNLNDLVTCLGETCPATEESFVLGTEVFHETTVSIEIELIAFDDDVQVISLTAKPYGSTVSNGNFSTRGGSLKKPPDFFTRGMQRSVGQGDAFR